MSAVRDALDSGADDTLARRKSKKQAPMVQQKRIRLSIDIDPDDYKKLTEFCADIAPAVGRVRVQNVWVIRALVGELWHDRSLKERVIETVREDNPL